MKISAMRQRAICKAPVIIDDMMGGRAEKWQDIAVVWAHLAPIKGSSVSEAKQKRISGNFKLTVRYREDLLLTRLVTVGGRNFKVISVTDSEERHDFIIFTVLEADLSYEDSSL